ncbi:hypothetical protein OIU34_18580 [Pararhizobium sp. BT-229]|uniref:hypothetical protein n=1 Tax=Pararhizobium sp. BT-229 TaxID=2986923 RepID=UPI0021F72844|nr:hypothetical protein [Pararhizobium sp. BT-229]MCV9963886.1 hypothetical protein [Pararhizobium sp. BT-229]
MKPEPKTHEVQDIRHAIEAAIDSSGFPREAAAVTYAVVDGFHCGEKTRALVFTVTVRQSRYRSLKRGERKAFYQGLRSCNPGGFGSQVFKDGETVVMKVRGGSIHSPVRIVLSIENDEPGRPTEVVPEEMFPDVTSHATAPLDAMIGLYSTDRNDQFGSGGAEPFSVSAVMSALVGDAVWGQGQLELLPLPARKGELLEHVRRVAGKVRPADRLRAKSWAGVLQLALVQERHNEIGDVRQRWVDEYGKYKSIDGGTGTCFTLPEGGPPSPKSGETLRKMATVCVRILEDLSHLRGSDANLAIDVQSINTLKELRAMAFGFLSDGHLSLHDRFEAYRNASRRGHELVAYAAWPM